MEGASCIDFWGLNPECETGNQNSPLWICSAVKSTDGRLALGLCSVQAEGREYMSQALCKERAALSIGLGRSLHTEPAPLLPHLLLLCCFPEPRNMAPIPNLETKPDVLGH